MFINQFKELWVIDFEFQPVLGELPRVICMVAKELHSKRIIRKWQGSLNDTIDFSREKVCLVAHYSLAELSCFKSLGWEFPSNICDTYVEFRNRTNGLGLSASLIEALKYFGLSNMTEKHKDHMRNLAIRGGPYSDQEKGELLDYCEQDVLNTELLFLKLMPNLSTNEVLLRGRYLAALAEVEARGVPIDNDLSCKLKENKEAIFRGVYGPVSEKYGVFSAEGAFSESLFEKYLVKNNISWPRLSSGRLDLKEEVFKDMSKFRPELQELIYFRELRRKYNVDKFEVGQDNRIRCMLSPFSSVTGRNQPSSNKFIFNSPSWTRALMRPAKGKALSYIDWSQQEFGIAASLSKDANLLAAYSSGDPYLAFAKQAGAAPSTATKATHKEVREKFKACVLAVQYGMGAASLATNMNQPQAKAKELLTLHRATYKTFWDWTEKVTDFARLNGFLQTRYGWRMLVTPVTKTTTIKNFLMQATGAELLRASIIVLNEENIKVCAPVHDAILIEDDEEKIGESTQIAQSIMADVSKTILENLNLKTDAQIIRYPERFVDPRGADMLSRIMTALHGIEVEHKSNSGVTPVQHLV